MQSVGIRELRNQVAVVVRRARHGERVVITVDGTPVAQLGPLHPEGSPSLADLASAGLIRLPGRIDRPPPPDPAVVPVDSRTDRVISELRGRGTSRQRP